MENSSDLSNTEGDGDGRKDASGTSSTFTTSRHRLFDRQTPIHQIMVGGKAADVFLWKRRHVSFGVIVVATVAWLVFEHSGLSFLSICSNVLLILIVLLFLRANYAVFRNKQSHTLPELELSEEMVNNAAASFRVKINYMLLMAHDITLGKDFRLFFKVVVCLWLLSVIGGFFSFFTLAYIANMGSILIDAVD
ncbi:reticulon-like protein B16 isoform X2 [Malania oleifera]|uniref:reticulon-like protein B16 isoform X2 n=1 Tax=Malania oleifera TaxID=397392 RepID=UPI0025AE5541|nr:reticulon-like protein B16 isoform X2 [Malania oleifera]